MVDGQPVTARDLGNNFFLEDAHLGQPRAQCVTALLQELNEHVRGSYVNDSIESVLAANPTFLDDFSLVVATQLPESSLRALAAACATRSLPLVVLRSYGLCGVVRLAACDHVVTEAHPDNVPSDLRVCSPFPELLAFASTRFGAMESLSAVERKHVPYVVLLLRALDAYKGTHGGALPSSYKEKQVVKAWLSATAEAWFGVGNAEDALNFEEAKAAVNTALAAPSLPANTRAVLAEAEARLGSAMSSEGSTSPIAPADATSNTCAPRDPSRRRAPAPIGACGAVRGCGAPARAHPAPRAACSRCGASLALARAGTSGRWRPGWRAMWRARAGACSRSSARSPT